jgi:hypothetical protein
MKNDTPRPIGWRAANRIVNGQDGGPGAEDLHALISIASTSTRNSGQAQADSASHEAVLTAFRESATSPRSTGRKVAQKTARTRRTSGALVLRFATAVLLVCGVGAAAATAGVLPEGVQRIAHHYFGIGGVSAPSTHVPSSGAGTTGHSNANSTGSSAVAVPPMTSAMPTDSAVMTTLCQQVSDHQSDWQSALDPADQATLIAAAGGEHKVKRYCARILAGNGKSAVPSPGPTDATGTPTATPTVTHGNAHVSHSPAAHSSGH